MIILNLISPSQRHLLKLKQFYQLLENFLGVLVIYSVVLAIILVPVNDSINRLNREISNRKQEIQLKNQSITEKVDELNKQIGVLSQIQNEFFNWSNFIIELSSLVPDEISLNHISNSFDSKEFEITGYAKTRDSLINFKENLENSTIFREIKIPLSNFLTQQEITFEITGELN